MGIYISQNSTPQDVLFLKSGNSFIMPQLIFYSNRNIMHYKSDSLAIQQLKLNNLHRGIIFSGRNSETKLDKIEYLYN